MIKYLKKYLKKILQTINTNNLELNKKKIIFYHIPRTSGTSIKFFFIKYFGEKKIFGINDFKIFDKEKLENNNIIFGHKIYSKISFKNKYEFTIIRNPIKRDLSLFNYYMNYNKANIGKKYKDNVVKSLNLNIKNYIDLQKNNYQDNIITRLFSNKYPIKDYNLFYGNKANNFISLKNKLTKIKKKNLNRYFNLTEDDCLKAIKNLQSINVWIFEKLNFKELYKNFGALIYFNDNLHVNKSIQTKYLNSKTNELLGSINEFDLKIYDFFKKK